MSTTPGSTRLRPEARDSVDVSPGLNPFPAPLTSPHIIVMDADLADLDRTGRLLSGRGFGITLSSTLLDDDTCAFLSADLLIVDLTTVLPAGARGAGNRLVSGMVQLQKVPVILCRGGHQPGGGSARPGVTTLAKPFHPADFLASVEALLYWRAEQQRSRSRSLRRQAVSLIGPVAYELGN